METNAITQLSESGDINIPLTIRDILHWQNGMELDLKITSFGLLIQPNQVKRKKRRLEEFRGFLKHQGTPLSDEQLCASVNYLENE
ncbi:hypothetical protein TI05_05235 [Achromatium sp. WMS3]|nr:hypothetical protein TI05_05235 [Achromatium sp. WMS3]